jgi:hypothetical protein
MVELQDTKAEIEVLMGELVAEDGHLDSRRDALQAALHSHARMARANGRPEDAQALERLSDTLVLTRAELVYDGVYDTHYRGMRNSVMVKEARLTLPSGVLTLRELSTQKEYTDDGDDEMESHRRLHISGCCNGGGVVSSWRFDQSNEFSGFRLSLLHAEAELYRQRQLQLAKILSAAEATGDLAKAGEMRTHIVAAEEKNAKETSSLALMSPELRDAIRGFDELLRVALGAEQCAPAPGPSPKPMIAEAVLEACFGRCWPPHWPPI